jgi:hypothetical protein
MNRVVSMLLARNNFDPFQTSHGIEFSTGLDGISMKTGFFTSKMDTVKISKGLESKLKFTSYKFFRKIPQFCIMRVNNLLKLTL